MTDYFGISRQAFYKAEKLMQEKVLSEQLALEMVNDIRCRQPKIGGKKLYYLLSDDLQKLPSKIGRDALFTLLRNNLLLVCRKRSRFSTTNSNHSNKVYPNLIKGLVVTKPDQVLISDITYIRRIGGFSYLSVVSDLYSRKILGYYVSGNLSMEGPLMALKNSLRQLNNNEKNDTIHHSDRGIQYSSFRYTDKLKKYKIRISMSAKGNPYDNAVMERIMGILKQEFLLDQTFQNIESIRKAVSEAVIIYNEERPHLSLAYKTPEMVYNENDSEKAA
jgi:transposase InsO family protein